MCIYFSNEILFKLLKRIEKFTLLVRTFFLDFVARKQNRKKMKSIFFLCKYIKTKFKKKERGIKKINKKIINFLI